MEMIIDGCPEQGIFWLKDVFSLVEYAPTFDRSVYWEIRQIPMNFFIQKAYP